MDHVLWLASGAYTPVGPDSIPLDMSRPAAGTPLDFTVPKPLSQDIGADDEQLRNVGGYDHNFDLSPAQGLRLAARLAGDRSGIVMETWTEKPGIQFYSGNFLNARGGKGGVVSAANYFPEECARVVALYREQGRGAAQAYYDTLQALIRKTGARGSVSGVKCCMNLLGYAGGFPRKPVLPAAPQLEQEMRQALEAAGHPVH